VLPHRLTALWTYPNWSLLPVVLLSSPLIVVGRKAAVRIVGLALVVPLIALLIAPVNALVHHLGGSTDDHSRHSLLAATIDRAWRDTTSRPLRWVGGQEYLLALSDFYLPPSARFLAADAAASGAAIARDGIALACPASDAACVARIDALGAAAGGRRSEVELARSFLGIRGRGERFVIIIVPPSEANTP